MNTEVKKMNGGKLVRGILLGTLVGGVAGVLMAPRSGKKTREMLREKGVEWGNGLKSKFNK